MSFGRAMAREVRLMNEDVLQFFDATALEVADAIEVADERFSIGIVTAGEGSIVGDFGSMPIRRGDTFALPASLALRVEAGREPLRVRAVPRAEREEMSPS